MALAEAWIVARIRADDHAVMEICSVQPDQASALAACVDENIAATRYEVGRDYTNVWSFEMITRANPQISVIDGHDGPR